MIIYISFYLVHTHHTLLMYLVIGEKKSTLGFFRGSGFWALNLDLDLVPKNLDLPRVLFRVFGYHQTTSLSHVLQLLIE